MDEGIQLPLPLFDGFSPSPNDSNDAKTDESISNNSATESSEIQPLLTGFQELLLEAELLPNF